MMIPSAPAKRWNALFLLVVYPVFAFILLHRILVYLSARRAAGARGSK